MPPKLLLFLSYSHALTIEILSRLVSFSPWSADFRESKLCGPSCIPCTSTCSHLSNTQTFPLASSQSSNFLYKIVRLCFNAITASTPAYLSDLLHLYSPFRSHRSSADTCLLKIPLFKCKTKGDRPFSYFDPSVWNSLPLHIRNATTIDTLRLL